MATTRRKTKSVPRRKVVPTRTRTCKVEPKVLAILDEFDLLQVNRLAGLIELKKVENTALHNLFNQMTKEIKIKYELEGNITIDFNSGNITEAVDRSGE